MEFEPRAVRLLPVVRELGSADVDLSLGWARPMRPLSVPRFPCVLLSLLSLNKYS